VSRQIGAVPDICCIVTRRLVESVGGGFHPVVSSAIAIFEHVCWNVMLCGAMSCLQDQTLCCEAILSAEHSACLGSSIGVIVVLLWARWWAFGSWSYRFIVWPV